MGPHARDEIRSILTILRSEGRFSEEEERSLSGVFDRVGFAQPPLDVERGLERLRAETDGLHSDGLVRSTARSRTLIAAAVFVIIVGAAALLFRPGPDGVPGEALVDSIHGDVRFEREGRLLPLEMGSTLGAGDTVLTGPHSFAGLCYRDDIIIQIQQNSRFRVDQITTGAEGGLKAVVELSYGTALFGFKKLGRGDAAEVRTPTSVAGVRGTSFGVSVSEGRDVRYEVLDGKISVRKRVMLSPSMALDEETGRAVEDLERDLALQAVTVGAKEACEVKEKDVRALADKVEAAIQNVKLRDEHADSGRLLSAFASIAAESPAPSIYTAKESATSMMRELRGISERLHGRETQNHTIVEDRVADAFNRDKWMDRAGASYVLSDESRGIFLAVGADGRVDALKGDALAWTFKSGSPITAQPVTGHGAAYLVTADERIIALSLDTGKMLWARRIDGVLYFGVRPAIYGNGLYIATSKGVLYRFDARGGEEWRMSLPAASCSTPVADGGRLFVPLLDGKIHVVDISLRQTVRLIDSGRIAGPTVRLWDGLLYYANFEGIVACYDIGRDKTKWRHKMQGAVTADPVISGEYIYVVSSLGDAAKLSLDGELMWNVNLGGPVNRSPIVAGRELFVLSQRVFYAVDIAGGTVQWSFVIPTASTTNIAVSGGILYFGTEGNGIYQISR